MRGEQVWGEPYSAGRACFTNRKRTANHRFLEELFCFPLGCRPTTGTKTPRYKGAFAKLANLAPRKGASFCLVSEVQPTALGRSRAGKSSGRPSPSLASPSPNFESDSNPNPHPIPNSAFMRRPHHEHEALTLTLALTFPRTSPRKQECFGHLRSKRKEQKSIAKNDWPSSPLACRPATRRGCGTKINI